jgi:hypothetical protein
MATVDKSVGAAQPAPGSVDTAIITTPTARKPTTKKPTTATKLKLKGGFFAAKPKRATKTTNTSSNVNVNAAKTESHLPTLLQEQPIPATKEEPPKADPPRAVTSMTDVKAQIKEMTKTCLDSLELGTKVFLPICSDILSVLIHHHMQLRGERDEGEKKCL